MPSRATRLLLALSVLVGCGPAAEPSDAGTDTALSSPSCGGEDADLWYPRGRCGLGGLACGSGQRCAYGVGAVNGLLQVCVDALAAPVAEGGACHGMVALVPGPCGQSETYQSSDCDDGLVCNRGTCVQPCAQWGDFMLHPDLCVDPEYCPGVLEACETPTLCDPRDASSCADGRECHLWSAPSGERRMWTCQRRAATATTGRFAPPCRSASDCLAGECAGGCREVAGLCTVVSSDAAVPDAGASSGCPGASACTFLGTTSAGDQVGVCL